MIGSAVPYHINNFELEHCRLARSESALLRMSYFGCDLERNRSAALRYSQDVETWIFPKEVLHPCLGYEEGPSICIGVVVRKAADWQAVPQSLHVDYRTITDLLDNPPNSGCNFSIFLSHHGLPNDGWWIKFTLPRFSDHTTLYTVSLITRFNRRRNHSA
ncbi:hypothetical protein K458DRAFT_7378 [Lentithecium fluviatile CBS 122367]|uniref:Uncharacterized protein n=1 Tax=Lentithecium fluviatile CBS 122367 TaxID=1168545 RepID=A0A6G1JP14_9PLEO|nr:hypothetical protein K458DRAFT_7378 [Lentithecium fluviatile CBS 122367]